MKYLMGTFGFDDFYKERVKVDDGRVVSLNLENTWIPNYVSESLKKLKGLKSLNLTKTGFDREDVKSLKGELNNLDYIILKMEKEEWRIIYEWKEKYDSTGTYTYYPQMVKIY